MLDPLECGKGKLDDPVMMTWALRRYRCARVASPDLCRSMEEAWFDDLSLHRWIDADDDDVLTDLFHSLPAKRFSNLRSTVLERWKTWKGPLARHAAPVLLESPVDDVVSTFVEHIEGALDTDKTLAVIHSLVDLPKPMGLDLLRGITRRVSDLENGDFLKTFLLGALLHPTLALDPNGLVPVTKVCVSAWEAEEGGANRLLRVMCSALFNSMALFENAMDLMDGEDAPAFRSLRPLFVDGAPLDECDRILTKTDPGPDAFSLLEKHRASSAVTTNAFSVIGIVRSMDGMEDREMACFAVAAVLHAFELGGLDADTLSVEEVLDILTLDLSENQHFEALTERLRSFESKDVAISVNERMPMFMDTWGEIHLAKLAGELRLIDAIPTLIDCLGEDRDDSLCEAAEEALVRIGEPAQLAVIARWDELDRSQEIYGGGVLEQVGGAHASAFAVERFRELFVDGTDEDWCALAEAAPDERAIDLLEPEVRRKQPLIDETFYRLCVLAGREHEHLEDVRARVMENRRRVLDRLAAFADGNLPGPSDTVTLALKCERCGDVNQYEVKDVVSGTSASKPPFFIGDEFPCASCGEWPDFELTSQAMMGLMATAMISAREEAGLQRNSPLRFVDVVYRWEQRPAPEVMAELKAAVASNPDSIVGHLRLGRTQYRFNRLKRAAECYGRVLELEPDSMEAGLGLAQVMADTGKEEDSYYRLRVMLERKEKWRFFRVDEVPPATLREEFAELHNELQAALGIHDRPLLHPSFLGSDRKIGRNDPCPCGSGKKYKKCCLK